MKVDLYNGERLLAQQEVAAGDVGTTLGQLLERLDPEAASSSGGGLEVRPAAARCMLLVPRHLARPCAAV